MEHAEMLETAALWFSRAIDWLNKHGFDYRGLIPMGLALPATEGMYK
jgi:type II secretory pathway component PulL